MELSKIIEQAEHKFGQVISAHQHGGEQDYILVIHRDFPSNSKNPFMTVRAQVIDEPDIGPNEETLGFNWGHYDLDADQVKDILNRMDNATSRARANGSGSSVYLKDIHENLQYGAHILANGCLVNSKDIPENACSTAYLCGQGDIWGPALKLEEAMWRFIHDVNDTTSAMTVLYKWGLLYHAYWFIK